jgi:predicted small secreted protein
MEMSLKSFLLLSLIMGLIANYSTSCQTTSGLSKDVESHGKAIQGK